MVVSPIQVLLDLIDECYETKAWHGTNLRGSVRGLTVAEAAWRPGPERRNVWEHVVHAAYWKYTVRRRVLGEKRGSFALKGSNWFVRDGGDEAEWRADLALLDSSHRSMREAVAQLTPNDLPIFPAGSKVSNAMIVRGIAAHDVYHAGQIQLLERLARTALGLE